MARVIRKLTFHQDPMDDSLGVADSIQCPIRDDLVSISFPTIPVSSLTDTNWTQD